MVGTVGFGGEKNLGGTTSAYFDTATAQKVLGTPGSVRRDRRERRGRREPDRARRAPERGAARTAPRPSPARPSPRRTPTRSRRTSRSSGILFMIFAGIALFVGSFIIWNTFTMIVTQRSREIALLRAIGATRRQVMRSLLLEAVMLGVAASAIGLGLGLAVAKGLKTLMDAVGFSLPSHVAAARAPHHLGLAAGRHRRHRRRRPGPGSPRHQGAARRGAARVDPRCGEAVEAACLHRARPILGAGAAGMLVGAVRRRRHEGLRARAARRDGRCHGLAAAGGPSAGGG